MNFLSPLVLWFLPTALIPLLTHFWIKNNGQKIEFSDLTLIRKIESHTLSRSKLKNSLLIFLRCGILLSLILAYAKPIQYQSQIGKPASKKMGIDLAILIDESYSMGYLEGGRTRLNLLMTSAQDILKKLKPEDRVAIIPFSDQLEIPKDQIHWLPPAFAQQQLAQVHLTFKGTNFKVPIDALEKRWPQKKSSRKVVLILSDNARHGMPDKTSPLTRSVLWLGIDWGQHSPNSSIATVKPAESINTTHPKLMALIDSKNSSTLTLSLIPHWTSRLNIEGSLGIKPAILDLPSEFSQNKIIGKASLRVDNLPIDDSYFFSFSLPAKPKILCLYGNPSFLQPPHSGYFIQKILGESGNGILPYQTSYQELGNENVLDLNQYQAVILADFNELPPSLLSQLTAFIKAGKGLWVLPGLNSPLDAFSSINSWAPATIGPLVQEETPGIKLGKSLNKEDFSDFNLNEISIDRYHLLQIKNNATALFQSSNGYPLLVCDQKKPICVMAFSLGITSSNIAAKPAFFIWMKTLLRQIVGKPEKIKNLNLTVGESIQKKWKKEEAAPVFVSLKNPDGQSTRLYVKNRTLRSPALLTPGLYELQQGNSSLVYALNIDRSHHESDLTPLASPPWALLPFHSWTQDFLRAIRGKKESSHFLFLALLLLIAEMFLSALPRKITLGKKNIFSSLKILALGIFILVSMHLPLAAENVNSFIWTQLQIGPDWDPYPESYSEILSYVSSLTSVQITQKRRVITLKDPLLFSSPLVVLAGRRAPAPLSAEDTQTLRRYLRAGGMLWIEDTSGIAGGPFESWTRETLKRVFPQLGLVSVKPENVLFKTFFLLREPGGLIIQNPALEEIDYNNRAAVIYSRDDLLGVWPQDALGNPLYPTVPGGNAQREAGKRMTLNIILYALTGDYKSDAVHQPYLLEKMRSGIP